DVISKHDRIEEIQSEAEACRTDGLTGMEIRNSVVIVVVPCVSCVEEQRTAQTGNSEGGEYRGNERRRVDQGKAQFMRSEPHLLATHRIESETADIPRSARYKQSRFFTLIPADRTPGSECDRGEDPMVGPYVKLTGEVVDVGIADIGGIRRCESGSPAGDRTVRRVQRVVVYQRQFV